MAMEATLISPKTEVVLFPGNRFSSPKFPAPASPSSLQSSSSTPKRTNSRWSLKCSVNGNDQGQVIQATTYPRPSEIPWSKEHANTVHLIGYVGCPVEIKHLPSGKVVATTSLAVRKSATETGWITLTFWDELANTAYQLVEKGQQIYVCGRLVIDSFQTEDGTRRTYYKVSVQQLNPVERNFSTMSPYNSESNWTSSETFGSNGGSNASSTEELWQAYFANPTEWWDNRQTKTNPKYPDFKHKDTGESLWLDRKNNPSWVTSQLEILDERMNSADDQNEQMRVRPMSTDELMLF